jgi:hypothetical protein
MSAQLHVARSFSTGVNWYGKKYMITWWFFFYIDKKNKGTPGDDVGDASDESKKTNILLNT